MLFESYLVFLGLEFTVLILAYLLYYRPSTEPKKTVYDPWGFWSQQ